MGRNQIDQIVRYPALPIQHRTHRPSSHTSERHYPIRNPDLLQPSEECSPVGSLLAGASTTNGMLHCDPAAHGVRVKAHIRPIAIVIAHLDTFHVVDTPPEIASSAGID